MQNCLNKEITMTGKITTAIEKYDRTQSRTEFSARSEYKTSDSTSTGHHRMYLSDYLEILGKRKWIVIWTFIVIVGLTTAVSMILRPEYESTSQVFVGNQPTLMNPLGDNSDRISEIYLNYQTQVNLLGNKRLARRVIDELDLGNHINFETIQGSISSKIKVRSTLIPFASPLKTIENNDYIYDAKILDWYMHNLSIEPVRDSSLINIRFTGYNPELVTQIVNMHAQIAIEDAVQEHQKQAKNTLDWIKSQIEKQRFEVEKSQEALYLFKKKNNVLSMEDNQSSFSREMNELSNALLRAQTERITKQAAYFQLKDIIKDKKDALLMPEISNFSVIQNLRNELIGLQSTKVEMSTKYGPKHPKMINLSQGIEQIIMEIEKEVDRQIVIIGGELERAFKIEKSLFESLDEQKKKAIELGEDSIQFEVLKQQSNTSQDIYNLLLKQAEQLGLSSAIINSNLRISERAEIPIKPILPDLVLNVEIAIFLALLLGVGLAFLIDSLDTSIKTSTDINVRLGMPILGIIPYNKLLKNKKDNLIASLDSDNGNKNGMLSAAIQRISYHLPLETKIRADRGIGRILAVESVSAGEGKSTVISRLAMNFSDAGLRVLLVDWDFQRPRLNKIFNIKQNGRGLTSYFSYIMQHNLVDGSLSEYSVNDLFFLLSLKKESGKLEVTNDDWTIDAFFQNGVLIYLQSLDNPENNRIGTMLLNAGFITENQLNDALQRHQRTGQSLGYILINAGYITREKLRGPLKLQMEETIQKLFSWKKGSFTFSPGVVELYDNEKILFNEDYTSLINNLERTLANCFIDNELMAHIAGLSKPNLFLLPAGTSNKRLDALNLALVSKIFDKLKQHFDVILVDTPPLDAQTGIESIFQFIDAMILVIKAGNLSVKDLKTALTHLPQDKIIGTVLNQTRQNLRPYNY